VHIPMIMRFPSRLEQADFTGATSLVDVMPTLLELVGQPIPEGLQGQSLAPWLTGNASFETAPDYAFCERVQADPGLMRRVGPEQPGAFMARGKGWKYILYPDGGEYLYNLQHDPQETTNLADREPGKKVELRAKLEDWLARTGWSGRPLPAAT
jgi:arylsulfatase A-like enzyme